MDMKYAVLLMTDISTFQERFELALNVHGVSYHRAVVETEDYIQDEAAMLKEKFIDGASRHGFPIKLHRVPFEYGHHDIRFFIAHDPVGRVVALYTISKQFYGPSETKTVITAVTATEHMRTFSEMRTE